MSIIRVLIGDNYDEVDVSENFKIDIKYSLKDIQSYGSRTASYTKSIRVINTLKTANVFKNLFDIESEDAFNITSTVKAAIEVDDNIVINGFIKITNSTAEYYDVVIYTSNVDIFTKVSDKLIYGNEDSSDDILFTSFTNHNPTQSYIRNSWSTYVGTEDFIYPFINHNSSSMYTGLYKDSPYYIYPALSTRKLFDQIITDNDYTYELSTDIEQYIDNMYIPYNGITTDSTIAFPSENLVKVNFYDVSEGGFIHESELGNLTIEGTTYNYYKHLNFGTGSYNNYDYEDSDVLPTTEYLEIQNDGDIQFTIKTNNGSRNEEFDTSDDADGINVGVLVIQPGIIDNINEMVKLPFDTWVDASFPIPDYWNDDPQTVNIPINNIKKGARVYLIINYDNAGTADETLLTTSSTANTIDFSFNDWPYSVLGTRNENDFLPRNYKQSDFIRDIFNIFNAFIITSDVDPNHLIIRSYNDFYSNRELLDITEFIDINSVKHKSLANTIAATTNFIMGEDDNDFRLNDYKDQFDRGYSDITITNRDINDTSIINKIATSDNDIEITMMGTIIEQLPTDNTDRIPQIFNGERYSTEFAPRILFVNQNGNLAWGGDVANGTTVSSYLSLDTNYNKYVDSIDNLCLKFNNIDRYSGLILNTDESNVSIYNKYYKNDLERRFSVESRIITVKCIIDTNILNRLKEFNNIIKIENKGLYRLENIKKYTINTNEATLELVKEIDESILSYDNLLTVNIVELSPTSTSSDTSGSGSSGGGGTPSTGEGITEAEADARYLKKISDDTTVGQLTISSSNFEQLRLGYNVSNNTSIGYYDGTALRAATQYDKNNNRYVIWNMVADSAMRVGSGLDGLEYSNNQSTYYKVYHAGNDGSGSSLDADTLDTYHASAFPRKAEDATITGTWTYNASVYFKQPTRHYNSGGSTTYMNNDPRWSGDVGRQHWYATRANGSLYGQAGIGLYNGSDSTYYYIDAVTGGLSMSGKLKIGDENSTPVETLDVLGNAKISDVMVTTNWFSGAGLKIRSTSTTTNGGRGLSISASATDNYGWSMYAVRGAGGPNSDLVFRKHNNSNIGTVQFKIDYNGNVAIGSHTPTEKLDVVGNGKFSSNVSAANQTDNTTIPVGTSELQGYGIMMNRSASYITNNYVGGNIQFGIGSTHNSGRVMRLASSGVYIGVNDTTPTERLQIEGNQLLTGFIKETGTFVSGFAGLLWKLDPDDSGDSHLTVDRLTVRGRMDVYELVINQIRATNGSLWVSDALKIESLTVTVATAVGETTVFNYEEDTNATFVVNDIVKAQEFDGRNVRLFYGRVTVVNDTSKQVAVITLSGGDVAPWAGATLVRIGNTTDTNRQGALYLTSSDNSSPYMDIIDGVTSSSLTNKTRLRLGKLDGVGSNTGYGIWGSSDGTIENFVISSDGYAKIAGWNFDSTYLWANNKFGSGAGLELKGGTTPRVIVSKDSTNYVNMYYNSTSDWGIQGRDGGGAHVFQLGSTNQIAGWIFNDKYLYNSNLWLASSDLSAANAANRLLIGNWTGTNPLVKVLGNSTSDYVQMFWSSTSSWGLLGRTGVLGNVFQLGSTNNIAGWSFNNYAIWKEDSGKFLGMNNSTTTSPVASNRLRNGFTIYHDDSVVGTDGFKLLRIGQVADLNSAGTFTTNDNYGIQIGSKISGVYKDVFRIDESGALIAGFSFDDEEISSTYMRLNSTSSSASLMLLANTGSRNGLIFNNVASLKYTDGIFMNYTSSINGWMEIVNASGDISLYSTSDIVFNQYTNSVISDCPFIFNDVATFNNEININSLVKGNAYTNGNFATSEGSATQLPTTTNVFLATHTVTTRYVKLPVASAVTDGTVIKVGNFDGSGDLKIVASSASPMRTATTTIYTSGTRVTLTGSNHWVEFVYLYSAWNLSDNYNS